MKKLLVLLLIPFFAFSQTNPDREYWQTNKWTPKEGMNAEFEAGVAKKTDKFNSELLKLLWLHIKLLLGKTKESI